MKRSQAGQVFSGLSLLLVLAVGAAGAQSAEGTLATLPPDEQVSGAGDAPSSQRTGPFVRHPEGVKAMDQIKSPYCPGAMLEVCSSAAGAALRDSIDALAVSGWSADEIVDWVLAEYGDEYLALPRRQGKALVAWVVPPLAVFLGFGVVVVALRRMRSNRPPKTIRDDVSPEEEDRLREALAELEAEEEAPFL